MQSICLADGAQDFLLDVVVHLPPHHDNEFFLTHALVAPRERPPFYDELLCSMTHHLALIDKSAHEAYTSRPIRHVDAWVK